MAFEGLNLGTQAMRAAQAELDTIGHNIANVNTRGYSRQRVHLEANTPLNIFPGQKGTGVSAVELLRITDQFARGQLEGETPKLGEHSMRSQILDQLEQVLNEPQESGLQNTLSKFFNAFQTLANAPEEAGVRRLVVQRAQGLVDKLHQLSKSVKDIQNQADELVRFKVVEVNNLSKRIASLNDQIASVEANPQQHANDLRDQRELAIRDLNQILRVSNFEDSNHNLFVEAQGAVLVAANRSFDLSITSDPVTGHLVPSDTATGMPVVLLGGEMKGLRDVRDQDLQDIVDSLDTLARSIVEQVNRQHTQGTTLLGHDQVVSETSLTDTSLPLNTLQDFEFPPKLGSFFVSVYDEATGLLVEQTQINVNPGTDSLDDLILDMNTNLTRVTASVNGANQLVIQADAGFRFQFVEDGTGQGDTSDFLLAMGINTVFTGNSASSMELKTEVLNDGNLLTAGSSHSPGDNTNALRMADLQNQLLLNNNTATFTQSYSTLVSGVGVQTQTANQNLDTQQSLNALLEERLAATAGVSLDEEAANLLAFQRMFQGAAKYVQVINSVLDSLVNLV